MLTALTRDSLARNSVLIMASTLGTSGLGYLFWMLAARELPRSAVGAATAVISVAAVVSMVSNLGVGHMFIQRLPGAAPADWSRIVGAGLLLGCASTTGAALAAAGLLPRLAGNFAFLGGLAEAGAVIATAVALTASTLLDYVFVAHRAGHGMLGRNLALATGKLLALGGLTAAGLGSAAAILLAWTVPSIAVTAYTVGRSLPRMRAAGSKPIWRPARAGIGAELGHIRRALTGHHLINLCQAGPAAMLPVLVTARLGAAENAHFYVAWMTASVLFMVSPAVASALYAERANDGAGRSASLSKAALVVLVVIGVPAAALFGLGGRVLGLFSPGYAAAGGTLLQLLVLAAVPDAITNLAVAHWRSLGHMRRCLRLNLLIAAACLALTWLLLPVLGIEAAGVAWLAGQSAGALAVAAHAWRAHLARRPFPARAARRPRIPRPARPASHPAAFRGRTAAPFRRRTRRPARQSRPRSRSWRVP